MLSIAQQLNLLDLYEEEISQSFATYKEKLDGIRRLLSSTHFDELFARGVESEDWSDFGRSLWFELRHSPMNNVLYEEVCAFLKRVSPDLHELISLNNDGAVYLHNLKKVLKISPTLLRLLDADGFLCFALDIRGFKKLASQLLLRLQAGSLSAESAKKHILRHFPLLGPYAFEHIVFGVQKGSTEGAEWVKRCYPDFMAEYDLACDDERCPRGLYFIVEPDENIGDALQAADTLGADAPNAFDVRFSKIPQAHLRSCVLGLAKEVPLQLRDYQWELAKSACDGLNSAICAPTGSGKTVVAAYVIRQHILSRTMAQKHFKICFFVPTSALVEQQKELLATYLGHCAKVTGIHGGNPTGSNPVVGTIRDADVVVITPQLIVNLLDQTTAVEGEVREEFSLSTFSMLMFDEAHHATDDHPYNIILREHYHVLKETGIGGKDIPQIIGLTASLGVGGATTKDLNDALQHTVGVCASLDTYSISRVRQHVDQLKEFVASTHDDFRYYSYRELDRSEPYNVLKGFLKELEGEIDSSAEVKHNKDLRKVLSTERPDHLLIAYETWTGEASKRVKESSVLSQEARELLMHHIEQLRILFSAIDQMKLFNWAAASAYLDGAQHCHVSFGRDLATRMDAERRRLDAIASEYESEMFVDLVRILEEQFKREPNSRVIIFLRTREYCLKLSRVLTQKSSFEAAHLTGANASTELGGQTSNAQKAAIERFKSGKTPILCVTSVAEEGLDIAACNLVISYNHTSNEIGHVQRRGRGRSLNAKSISMACDANIRKAHDQNIIRERLMKQVLEFIDTQPSYWFEHKVKAAISAMREERLLEQTTKREAAERQKNNPNTYLLLCSSCDGYVTKADAIRTFQKVHHIIVDKDYWTRVDVLELTESAAQLFKEMAYPQLGVHRCGHKRRDGKVCGQELGRIMLFKNILLPIVKCERVVFVEVPKGYASQAPPLNANRFPCKKWKKAHEKCFTPPPIETFDMKMMDQASKQPKFSDRLLATFENASFAESLRQFRNIGD